MPYRSEAQSAFIHAKAAAGVPWAKKFVRDAHGTHVPKVKHVRGRVGKKRGKP
jgi:hypothetical protein